MPTRRKNYMDAKERYTQWLSLLDKNDPLYLELESIHGHSDEIEDRFYQDLSFGTAGLRGKTGAGTNRMNRITVGRAVQAAAEVIRGQGQGACEKGMIIVHDPRYYSEEFSVLAAEILAANGITAYVFDSLRPTPELAFLIRYMKTSGGLNITASHNPREYNGLKVYAADGCQVGQEDADAIFNCMLSINPFADVQRIPFAEGIEQRKIVLLTQHHDDAYLNQVLSLSIHSGDDLDLSIPLVYTPLNGAGSVPFQKMLEKKGFTSFHVVAEQKEPDPDFTTVGYPNPEDPAAFAMSERLGKETGAELLMATDPDADRFAIEILCPDGNYIPLNGNQTGYLLVNYILEGKQKAGTLPANGAMVKSIVTGTLSTDIARFYGVTMFETLTGFKNICGKIPWLEENGYRFLFGYEESVGYAACEEIRDKDGISAGMLVAEAAAYYRKQGKTLYDVLQEIYERYGSWSEEEPNLVLEGITGSRRIARMMSSLRQEPLQKAGGLKVIRTIDYLHGYEEIPASNVLRYMLEDGSWFAIRPSGTEPKIKFYFYASGKSPEQANEKNHLLKEDVMARVLAVE